MKDTPFTADRLLAMYDRVAEAEDAIPRLRRFVLDLAVRGKLVEQDAGDEPAAELLKRIAKEKARLVKAGQIKKGEVGDLDGDDAPFELPSNWAWTRLGSIGDWGAGSTPSRGNSELYGGTVTWLKSGELNDNTALKGSEETVTELAVSKGSFRVNKRGDILIAMYGATIGKLAILAETAVTNQAVCGCTPFEGVSNRFLFLFLLSHRTKFHAASEGGAQPNISKIKIVNTPFPLPPFAEQQRIVTMVEELMALCDRLQAARVGREGARDRLTAATWARLTAPETDAETFPTHARAALQTLPTLTTRPDQIKTLRQTILNLAVRGKLVEQDASDEPAAVELQRTDERKRKASLKKPKALPAIVEDEMWCALPPGWEWVRWDRITNWITYGFTRPMPHEKVGVPIVTGKNVNWGRIILDTADRTSPAAFAELNDKDKPVKGDILITKDGSIGRTAIVDSDDPFCINQSVAVLWLRSCDASRRYLQMVLDSPQVQQTLLDKTAGVAIKHISIIDLGQMVFPLPPLAEQHRIVAKVEALMALCDQLESSLSTATTTRSRLLEALLHEALHPMPPMSDVAA